MKRRLFISKISFAASGLALGASVLTTEAKSLLKVANPLEISASDFPGLMNSLLEVWFPSGEKIMVKLKEVSTGIPNSFRTPFTLCFQSESDLKFNEGLCKLVLPEKGLLDIYLEKKRYPGGCEIIEANWN